MTNEPNEPYKEEIASLLSLIRLGFILIASIMGVGLGANELGIV